MAVQTHHSAPVVRVLFVCMGNICRSPLAEGAFRQLVQEAGLEQHIEIDSAGTHFYHVGEPPDARSVAVAAHHGLDISPQRARQLHVEDLEYWDYIVVMDKRNLRDVNAMVQNQPIKSKIALLLDFSRESWQETEVPDPYHGGKDGFEHVYQLVRSGCAGLLASLQESHRI